MRANKTNKTRRLYRRIQDETAVSPVVATLLLILIAVAAAAALFLFITTFQTHTQNSVGNPTPQATIVMGGSTSAYPFDSLVVSQFEQNNSNIAVSNNQGGSGAGMFSVCSGAVDIGAASSLQTPATLAANYGCPQGGNNAPVVTTVAYDGVDLITPVANTHGLISMSWDTLLSIYTTQSATQPSVSWASPTINGQAWAVTPTAVYNSGSGFTWNEIPAAVPNAVASGITQANTYGWAASAYALGGSWSPSSVPLAASSAAIAVGTGTTSGAPTNDIIPTATAPTLHVVAPTFSAANMLASTTFAVDVCSAPLVGNACVSPATESWQVTTCPSGSTTCDGITLPGGTTVATTGSDSAAVTYSAVPYTYSQGGLAIAGTLGTPVTCSPGCGTFAPTTDTQATAYSVVSYTTTGAGSITGVPGTAVSPCAWMICAGGSNAAIQTVGRSDISGTQQAFTARLLGISGQSPVTSLTSLNGNWGGCGSDGQLSSCAISATLQGNGNPGVISTVAANPNSIGFASDGLARASNSGVSCQGVASSGCGIGFEGVGQTSAVLPSLGASGSFASAIKNSLSATTGYAGWRPFIWVTLGQPAGEVGQLFTFVLDPANNQNFATESQEISIYSI